jgi:hypothetical protein
MYVRGTFRVYFDFSFGGRGFKLFKQILNLLPWAQAKRIKRFK